MVPALLLLTACGGSGTPVTSGPLNSNQVAQRVTDLTTVITDPTLTMTPAADLPSVPNVTYEGIFAANSTLSNDVLASIGVMNMTMNFDNNTLQGTVSNLYDGGGVPLIGTLDFTNGSIDRSLIGTSNAMSVTMGGTLTRNGDPFSYGSGVVLTGSLLGANADVMTATGTVPGRVGTTATTVTIGIAGEKQ